MEHLANKLVAWIRGQVAEAKLKGVVFGLSGGLDSSVVGALCRRAFPEDSLGLIIPCHSSQTDIEHAQAVARRFQIPTRTITLDEAFGSLLKVLPNGGDPDTKRLAEANVKVRLRMVTLYYIANRFHYLVVGTGNRNEISVGYFTKYGDGGVDIEPLANLLKGQVRELAIPLGVPGELTEQTPPAGLWDGQSDEEEMGISYDELDRYLSSGEVGRGVKKTADAMIKASAHKRSLPPVPPF
jgi:NAD+ synthase